MSYTDEQIYNSLPPGLQGDLKAFGALEGHTCKEMHNFMLEMRQKYEIPPWDAFTLLFQRAALGSGESKRMTRDTSWYLSDLTENGFVLNAHKSKDWCVVNLKITNNQSITSNVQVAVQPSKQLIWSYRSESAVLSKRVYSMSQFKNECQGSVPRERVISHAEQAVSNGLHSSDMVFIAHKRKCNKPYRTEQPQQTTELEAEPSSSVLPVLQEKCFTLSSEQHEVVLTVFELAAAKARELGMHSTIARWRNTLAPIIGSEVTHVQE